MVSIALATYNGEKYISEQLDSILNQSYSDFEVIICDDCSKDSTRKIIKDYSIRDSRIHLYENEINLGFKKNFIKCIGLCKGEYIAFCDQDDVWLPNHLSVLCENIGLNWYIGADAEVVDENLKPMGYTMKSVAGVSKLPDNFLDYVFFEVNNNIFQGTASMGRREFFIKYLEVPDCVSVHDHWFALVASIYEKAVYMDIPILLYRQHSNNAVGGVQESEGKKVVTSIVNKVIKRNKYKKESLKLFYNISKFITEKFPENKYYDELKELSNYYFNRINGKAISSLSFFKKNYKSLFWDNDKSKRYYYRMLNILIP